MAKMTDEFGSWPQTTEHGYWNAHDDVWVTDQHGGQLVSYNQTTHKGSVYLSGPIAGVTYHDARYGWRQEVASKLKPGITVLSPMRHEGHLAEVKGPLDAAGQLDHFFLGLEDHIREGSFGHRTVRRGTRQPSWSREGIDWYSC